MSSFSANGVWFQKNVHKAPDTEHSGKTKSCGRCGEVVVHRWIVGYRHRNCQCHRDSRLKKENDELKKQNDTLKVKGAEKSDSWIGRTNSNDTNETVPDYVPGSDIVTRMKNHPFNSMIQRTGLEGLRDLVKNYPVALADQGGVHAVVTAMKNLPNDASVQKEGSRVLYYFSLNKNVAVLIAQEAGGMEVLHAVSSTYQMAKRARDRVQKASDSFRKPAN